MSEFDDNAITVSVPVGDGPPPVPDSTKAECEQCGTDVWLSPATEYEIDRRNYPAEIWCVPCVIEEEDIEL